MLQHSLLVIFGLLFLLDCMVYYRVHSLKQPFLCRVINSGLENAGKDLIR